MGRASFHAFIIHIPNPRGARSYNFMAGGSGPWRRGAARHRVLMKLLQLATRRRAVLGASFLDEDDSFGYMHPETWLSGAVHASA